MTSAPLWLFEHFRSPASSCAAGKNPCRRHLLSFRKIFQSDQNSDAFEGYVEQVLAPELHAGDVVVMDNLSSHKGPRVQEMIQARGARLLFLPPYSPDV